MDATEHLYQLNPVCVVPPSKTDTVKTQLGDRLCANLECWDCCKKITIGFRSKEMLQLAQIETAEAHECEERLARDELRHPLLTSLRIQIKKGILCTRRCRYRAQPVRGFSYNALVRRRRSNALHIF